MMPTPEQILAYEQAAATKLESARCLLAAFALLGVPRSLLDLGCGPGHLVRVADALGVQAFGADISVAPSERPPLFRCDLTQGWHGPDAQMVLCLEVAEHLPEDSADTLCNTLIRSTKETLLFSAATPGQGGAGHINEQPNEYWREKLEGEYLDYDKVSTLSLRGSWMSVAHNAWWYGKNLMVFKQKNREEWNSG